MRANHPSPRPRRARRRRVVRAHAASADGARKVSKADRKGRPAAAPLVPRASLDEPELTLTREGRIYLGFTVVFSVTALALGDNLVFLMGCLLLGSAVVARRVALKNLPGVWVERQMPPRMRVGRPASIRWVVGVTRPTRSGTSTRTGLRLFDRLPRAARPKSVQIDIPVTTSIEPASTSTSLEFVGRGLKRVGAVRIESSYPIGLWRAVAKAPVSSRVLVWPREGKSSMRLYELLRGDAMAREQRAPGEDVFYGVREMREGDDPRRIHWRSSARRGAMVVSQWRAESGREIWIVLGRGAASAPGAEANFERAVSAAATVWRSAVAARLDARLVLGTKRVIHSKDGRRVTQGLDALAKVVRRRGRRPHAELTNLEKGAMTTRTVVYVASQPDAAVEQRLGVQGRARWAVLPAHDPRKLRIWIRGLP